MASPGAAYTGRFAPSPTGPLHMGSLLAALASYLDARSCGGRWLLRIEDIDPPREEPGAARAIIHSLRRHGLDWDGDITWQSHRSHYYEHALETLSARGALFRCSCSRKQLAAQRGRHREPCVAALNPDNFAWRLRAEQRLISFEDRLQGPQSENIALATGDTVLKRRDGLYAYQLAVVVDDWDSGITDVVRGHDLLGSTARQIYLQEKLGAPTPSYLHIPVLTNNRGEKLSKQRAAPALHDSQAETNLRRCLAFLGQPAPDTGCQSCAEILRWASQRWRVERIPKQKQIKI